MRRLAICKRISGPNGTILEEMCTGFPELYQHKSISMEKWNEVCMSRHVLRTDQLIGVSFSLLHSIKDAMSLCGGKVRESPQKIGRRLFFHFVWRIA